MLAPSTPTAVTDGGGDAQAGEVAVQVAGAEPAAKLDDRDGLPGAVGAGREVVQAGDLGRRVGDRRGRGGSAAVGPELRRGLRAVVQAEHGDHDAVQLGRHLQAAAAVPVRDACPGRDLGW